MARREVLRASCFRSLYIVVAQDQGVGMGQLEQGGDPVIHRHQADVTAVAFAGNVIIEHHAQPGRVDVRRVGKVEDGNLRRTLHQGLLKLEQIAQGNRAPQMEDAGLRCFARHDIEAQRFVIHTIRDCKNHAAK